MLENEKTGMTQEHQAEPSANAPEKEMAATKPTKRRDFLRIGMAATPVVMTLASRSALAWHCKSPSAWGSELINPHTSLRTNPGHQSYVDEVWTLANWRDNTSRSGIGIDKRPWDYLKTVRPSIVTQNTMSNGKFDYTKVTVGHAAAVLGFDIPIGCAANETVRSVLVTRPSSVGAYVLVAQLNLTVSPPLPKSEMEKCITVAELNKMGRGTYQPPGTNLVWGAEEIKKYLYNNWIVH